MNIKNGMKNIISNRSLDYKNDVSSIEKIKAANSFRKKYYVKPNKTQ